MVDQLLCQIFSYLTINILENSLIPTISHFRTFFLIIRILDGIMPGQSLP